jgi:hypothetical protein
MRKKEEEGGGSLRQEDPEFKSQPWLYSKIQFQKKKERKKKLGKGLGV